jgi:NAD(P)-dependent dehydrogenase (short-subunit alcohol dehydrogenase family)
MFDLTGRTALVTGAGQHTGAGIARLLAQRGAAVGVNDLVAERARASSEAIAAAGGRAHPVAFDVTDPEAVRAGVSELEGALGPVDILVNNAGVPSGMQLERFREMDPAGWSRYVDLNLYAVLHCAKRVIDGMCERRWGRIITISSLAGVSGFALGVSLYGAAKGGALSFMRHLAMEVAGRGVTVNSLTVGMMGHSAGAATEALAASVPVGRLGEPEDIGAAVVYLASEEASWVTGQTIGISGGAV